MNKRLYWLLTALVVIGLFLAACGPAATETPAEVEQPTEEVMEEPTEEVMEEPTSEVMEGPTGAVMEMDCFF